MDTELLAPTQLADWFGEVLPCGAAGPDCPQPATWETTLSCGHRGLLCSDHQARAEQRSAANPRAYWRCPYCRSKTNQPKWRRL